MKLSNVVDKALGVQNAGIYIPPYVQEVLSAVHDTRSKIERIVPINKERILFDVASIAKEDLDKAIRTTITLIEELTQDYNQRYAFSYELDSIEDNDYIVRLKKLLNGFLVFKTHRLFNSGEREIAVRVKNDQITYLNKTRYDGWRADLEKWLQAEETWIEIVNSEGISQQEAVYEEPSFQQEILSKETQEHEILYNQGVKENEDFQELFDAMLHLGQLENAFLVCLGRIKFFINSSNPTISNPMIVANAKYVKQWSNNILLISSDTIFQNPQKISEEILDLFELDAHFNYIPSKVRDELSKIAFTYV